MPDQSGASEIKPGNNWINRGKRCDHSPQAMKAVGGKTFCFQNDPALAKPQGGH
jgi:hypothetical protein